MSRFTNPAGSGGGGSSSDTFDKIYVTNNGNGQNVRIGDDAWIGDIDQANNISIIGIEDSAQGGIIFGDAHNAYIQASATDLNIGAAANVSIGADASPGWVNLYAYEGAYVNGAGIPGNKIVTFNDLSNAPASFAYGSFHDQTSFGPYAENTIHAMSMQTTDFNHDVRVAGINNSQITFDRAGKFNIAFSAQFHQTQSSGVVNIWLNKNGTPVSWSNTKLDINANNPFVVAAWNFFVEASANDYYEIMWSSSDNHTVLEALAATGSGANLHPGIPSVIVTVNQIG